MAEFRIAKSGTQFNGIHIPVGCVYGILPECAHNGKHYVRAFVWANDVSLIRKNQHFCVNIMPVNHAYPHRIYVDGSRGWAKDMQAFVRLYNAQNVGGVCLRRDISKLAPRDRRIGEYMCRPRPSEDDSPKMNQTKVSEPVLNPSNIGGRLLRQEAYYALRLGMECKI